MYVKRNYVRTTLLEPPITDFAVQVPNTLVQGLHQNYSLFLLQGLKKDVCLPFLTDPKFWKTWVAFFFFFLILNFAFLSRIVKIKFSKYIVTVPKLYYVGKEGMCLPHVSTRLFFVTYLNTENYMFYIAFLQHPDLKKKKKRSTL